MASNWDLGTVYKDPLLTNYSIAYKNAEFIADIIAPRKKVKKRTGFYYTFGFEAFKPEDSYRRPGTVANEIEWSGTTETYSMETQALVYPIPKEFLEEEDSPIQLWKSTVEILKDKIQLGREIRVRNIFSDASITKSGALAASAKWDAYTGATTDPFADIKTAKNSVFAGCRKKATHIVVPYLVAEALASHPDVLDLVKYTHSDLMTDGGLPGRLKGLIVVEASAGYTCSNTAPDEVWGDDVNVMYVNPKPGLRTINGITTFTKSLGRVRRWYSEKSESHFIEYSEVLGEELVCANAIYVIQDTLT